MSCRDRNLLGIQSDLLGAAALGIKNLLLVRYEDMRAEPEKQLARIVEEAKHGRGEKIHAATRTFQAIRIAVNDELRQLEAALAQSLAVMKRGARLCVISFHSLEDRIVKRFMRDASLEPLQYRGLPNVPKALQPKLKVVGKAVTASTEEIAANVRARSARLRVAERT